MLRSFRELRIVPLAGIPLFFGVTTVTACATILGIDDAERDADHAPEDADSGAPDGDHRR
jgi:hypothetical protein